MTESEFLAVTNDLLFMIETRIEEAGLDVESSFNEGILELELPDSSQIILNRHFVGQEIWVASTQGAFHYRLDQDGWRNTRTGAYLLVELAQLISLHLATDFTFNTI